MRTKSEPFAFRFTEFNPFTRESFAASRFWDLPGFVADVVVDELRLTCEEWDHLVENGLVIETTGHGAYRVPGAVVESCDSCRGDGRRRDPWGVIPGSRCGRCRGAGEYVLMPTGKLDQVEPAWSPVAV